MAMKQKGSHNFARADFATEQTRRVGRCCGHPLQFRLHGCWDTSESLLPHFGSFRPQLTRAPPRQGRAKACREFFQFSHGRLNLCEGASHPKNSGTRFLLALALILPHTLTVGSTPSQQVPPARQSVSKNALHFERMYARQAARLTLPQVAKRPDEKRHSGAGNN
jgi:hypothetical protein